MKRKYLNIGCLMAPDDNLAQLLDAKVLASLKPGALLFNVGRGDLIDD